ncbi:MAG: hypothetical protein NTZ56_20290 [Acidobacteria bacterium]|nr:hypothetical protein [Acidobacteriota bacterium]
MRVEQEKIDPFKTLPIDLGRCGEAQHGVEIDGRFGIRTLADQAGPHCVVQFRKLVRHAQ